MILYHANSEETFGDAQFVDGRVLLPRTNKNDDNDFGGYVNVNYHLLTVAEAMALARSLRVACGVEEPKAEEAADA